ncbi:unnamed protein product, partial [Symbiodinium pilosum]
GQRRNSGLHSSACCSPRRLRALPRGAAVLRGLGQGAHWPAPCAAVEGARQPCAARHVALRRVGLDGSRC